MKKERHILFTATFTTPFIHTDLNFLSRHFQVTSVIDFGLKALMQYLKLIRRVEITFSWFGSVYSSILILLGKFFGIRSILVLGGIDVSKEKALGYGIWNSWWKGILVKHGIRNASLVLAVDDSIKIKAITLCEYSGDNIQILPTGFNYDFWKPHGKKTKTILTVANCPDQSRVKVKGIDFLIDVARSAAELQFVIIGLNELLLPRLAIPKNVTVYPVLSQQEILAFAQKAKVYFQPSLSEGLPNALCEAMLCDCYPIGTNAGGIATAIGTTGTVIEYGDIPAAVTALKKGLKSTRNSAARDRIIENFSKESREQKLMEIILNMVPS